MKCAEGYGDLSSKSRSNARSCLHDFWKWLLKRREIHISEMPDFPEVPFELAFRKTVGKETQEQILEEVKRISYEINPRIWIGIKWLSTYFSIRPGELVRSLPRSFSEMPFFRHFKGIGGATPGSAFGPRYLYKWWVKACQNLGIEGVDLYAGTRHSTVIALGELFTPEELKHASMHSTNKAFERYFRVKPEAVRNVYEAGRRKGTSKKDSLNDSRITPKSSKRKL